MTTTRNVKQVSEELLESISAKNGQRALDLVTEFKTNIGQDSEFIVWITTPVNLTAVQSAITENFGIPHKAMMIKSRPGSSRGLRASFFLQAMENSLKRVI